MDDGDPLEFQVEVLAENADFDPWEEAVETEGECLMGCGAFAYLMELDESALDTFLNDLNEGI